MSLPAVKKLGLAAEYELEFMKGLETVLFAEIKSEFADNSSEALTYD